MKVKAVGSYVRRVTFFRPWDETLSASYLCNTFMFIGFVPFSVDLSNVLDEGKLYFAVWSEKVSSP